MKRHLFTTASALSLLLCAATAAMWVRSYWKPENWSIAATKRYFVLSDWGDLTFSMQRQVAASYGGVPDDYQLYVPKVLKDGRPEPFSMAFQWIHERAFTDRFGFQWFKSGIQPYPSNRAGFGWGRSRNSWMFPFLRRPSAA